MPDKQVVVDWVSTLLEAKEWIELPAQGDSMFPMIREGDRCRFVKVQAEGIRRGDIVLFIQQGRLVAHRYYDCTEVNGQLFYRLKGDANAGFDQPVQSENILGKLELIYKGKLRVRVNQPWGLWWGRVMLRNPWLARLIRRYLSRRVGS